MKRLLCALLAIASVAASTAAAGPLRGMLWPPYSWRRATVVETDVMAPMRDGVKLATDIRRPRRKGKYPVVLCRTPYGKKIWVEAATVPRGVAVAVQDCRGRYNSEGEFYPFINEQEDGYDTIEWLAKQPWCNSEVGMQGGGYAGDTQAQPSGDRPVGAWRRGADRRR